MEKDERSIEKYKAFYDSNESYRYYVDKCRESDGKTIEEELENKTIQEVGEWWMQVERER